MHIHVRPARIPAATAEAAHVYAAFAFARFGRRIRSVSIRFNGPRGGIDQACAVAVRLASPTAEIVVRDRDTAPLVAVSRALARAEGTGHTGRPRRTRTTPHGESKHMPHRRST